MNNRLKTFLRESLIIIFFSAILVIINIFCIPSSMSKWFHNAIALLFLGVAGYLFIKDWKRSHDLGKDPEIQKLRAMLDKSIEEEKRAAQLAPGSDQDK